MFLGIAMSSASSLLYAYRLSQFNSFLRTHCPQIWEQHGMGRVGASFLVKYNKLKSLPQEYESDNLLLNSKLTSLAWIHRSTYLGLTIVLTGVLFELLSLFDA